jgi:hypothetical protein
MGGACTTNGGRRRTRIGYWWESQKKRDQGRPRRWWLDNITIDLLAIVWGGVA